MHRRTVRKARFLAGFAALALALAPALAEARPGGGFSSGSRGSRSFNAPPATRTAPGGGTNTFDRSDMSRGGMNQATPARPPHGHRDRQDRPGRATPVRGPHGDCRAASVTGSPC